MKRLETLIDSITEELKEEVWGAIRRDEKKAYVSINTNDGYIEATASKEDETIKFSIFHDGDSKNECPRLVEYLENEFKDDYFWKDAEREIEEDNQDEFQRNGFADEADYWQWKEG